MDSCKQVYSGNEQNSVNPHYLLHCTGGIVIKNSVWGIVMITALILSLLGCNPANRSGFGGTIGDIAFDVNPKLGYTVYLNEDSTPIPYLVLTNDYNNSVLLLRKFVLDEPHIFNPNERFGSYYENSDIDTFLNEDFFNTLDADIQEIILESPITITEKSSIGVTGTDTVDIKRKIFLLSYAELGMPKSSTIPAEGKKLKFFNDAAARIACFENGIATSWWVRSVDTWDDTVAIGVSPDGTVGGGGVYYENGVRPAFCVSGKTAISKRNDIIDGEVVYAPDTS
jgi:hypothetical protein